MKIVHDTLEKDQERLQKIKRDAIACAAEYAHCIDKDRTEIALFWLQHILYDMLIIEAFQDKI